MACNLCGSNEELLLCEEFDIYFCKPCEYKYPQRLCKSLQIEHHHISERCIEIMNNPSIDSQSNGGKS